MISLVDLTAQYHSIKEEIDAAVLSTLESGHFILGPAVTRFEESIASYLGMNFAIGLASGTDALVLALRALNIGAGDEVIIPAYTFFATAGTVMSVGATCSTVCMISRISSDSPMIPLPPARASDVTSPSSIYLVVTMGATPCFFLISPPAPRASSALA